ncbi:MAG: hypothetical protein M1812_002738 [Candelaria pacifica]|nr:MAG: hypothetical protein M1812_002738 [Candelaria pacifica]
MGSNIKKIRLSLTEAQETTNKLEQDLVTSREAVQKLQKDLDEKHTQVLERERELKIAKEDVKRERVEKEELVTKSQDMRSGFDAEVSKILGVSDLTCWHTLERLGLDITRAELATGAHATKVRFDTSMVYGCVPKQYTSTAKVARVAAKITHSLGIKPAEYWGSKLLSIWHSWDTGLSHDSREELFWVILSLIGKVFAVGKASSLNIWLACQLGCSLLRCAPPVIQMGGFISQHISDMDKETNVFFMAGFMQLQVTETRRIEAAEPTGRETILGSLRALELNEGGDAVFFDCLSTSGQVSGCLLLLPGSMMIIAKLPNDEDLIWHNFNSACNFFIARFYVWLERLGGHNAVPELWRFNEDNKLSWKWLKNRGVLTGKPSPYYLDWEAAGGFNETIN